MLNFEQNSTVKWNGTGREETKRNARESEKDEGNGKFREWFQIECIWNFLLTKDVHLIENRNLN